MVGDSSPRFTPREVIIVDLLWLLAENPRKPLTSHHAYSLSVPPSRVSPSTPSIADYGTRMFACSCQSNISFSLFFLYLSAGDLPLTTHSRAHSFAPSFRTFLHHALTTHPFSFSLALVGEKWHAQKQPRGCRFRSARRSGRNERHDGSLPRRRV